jgi:hypothetical protein
MHHASFFVEVVRKLFELLRGHRLSCICCVLHHPNTICHKTSFPSSATTVLTPNLTLELLGSGWSDVLNFIVDDRVVDYFLGLWHCQRVGHSLQIPVVPNQFWLRDGD